MRRSIWSRCVRLVLLSLAAGWPCAGAVGDELLPEGLHVMSLEAWPNEVQLHGVHATAQLLITGHLETGEQVDLTRLATLETAPVTVQVSDLRSISPLSDGDETLRFRFGDHEVNVPVVVSGTQAVSDVSFVRQVAPALSKMGCNAGTCHGAKDGQRGFKLSLRGYDFQFDHLALTDDIGARRFNRANPDQSLMLLKASASVPHVGGKLTSVGERHYELIKQWIASGASLDLDAPRVVKIELLPNNPVLPRANMRQQMVVLATTSDGKVTDVTADAFIESGDIEVLSAERTGVITTLRRGEAAVLARYEGAYTASTVTVMGDRSGFVWTNPPVQNSIDELVYAKLQRVKILPSELCSDAEFVRRLTLDITGLLPTADEVRRFLDDPRPSQEKRDELVDRLVGSPEYVEHWTNKWADLLQVNQKFLGDVGAAGLREWIKSSVASNRPYDEFVREILTASGSNVANPAASYWKILRDPAAAMENTTHLFLAVRFNCNKCHDHPFERWTQDQYYNLTAFFAQVGLKEDPLFANQKIGGSAVEGATPLVEVVYDSGQGETTHDRTRQIVSPEFPYQGELVELNQGPRRQQLAEWMTSSENRYFASSYVNRLWGYLFGRGLIEPIDDIRAGNPATNPELLNALTDEFVQSGFDVQHVLKMICKSRVYQHSVVTNQWNEDDAINYSHALPRRLPAEVLFDAIHQATGSTARLPGVPAGFRAAELASTAEPLPFLDDFGRPPRESACECERSSGVVLGPIMKLVNGPTVNDAIVDPDNQLKQLVESEPDDARVIDEVFLRFLARRPTTDELHTCLAQWQAAREVDAELIARFEAETNRRLAGFEQWEAAPGDSLPEPIAAILKLARTERSEEQQQQLKEYFLQQDPRWSELKTGVELTRRQAEQYRLTAVQDLAWALINNPSFLFNH